MYENKTQNTREACTQGSYTQAAGAIGVGLWNGALEQVIHAGCIEDDSDVRV